MIEFEAIANKSHPMSLSANVQQRYEKYLQVCGTTTTNQRTQNSLLPKDKLVREVEE